MTALARFQVKIDTSAGLFGCWPWQAARNHHGYGVMRVPGERRNVLAHRHALELALGRPIAAGLGALHRCDNPPCCNPAHLYEGTHDQNMADMTARGRQHGQPPLGERHHSARLTEEQVRAIRRRAISEGLTAAALAREYGVTRSTVGRVLAGRNWKAVAA